MPETIALRAPLLALHRALLDHERRVYEKVHGRQSGADFLQTVIGDQGLEKIGAGLPAMDFFVDAPLVVE